MRFFIALEIPDQNKKELFEIQRQLKELIPQARLTDNEKLHLTIAFIGEQPDKLRGGLIDVMKKASQDIQPFTVIPAYLDGFPHRHRANTFWIGVKGDIDKLYTLRHRIKDGLNSLDLGVDERRYVPHIAIAKINGFKMASELEKELDELMSKEFEPIEVSSVKLFESIPNHGFHQHNTLFETPLLAAE